MKGYIIVNPYLVPKESIYQAERLKEEFDKLNVETKIVSDGFLSVTVDGDGKDIDSDLPDFAIYLDKDKYYSKVLESKGVRLFNSHESVRICDDKAETYLALSGKGVNLPKTILGGLCYSPSLKVNREWMEKISEKLGFPVIIKESFGSMGKGVYKADDIEELMEIADKVKTKPHLFQEYLSFDSGADIRVIVIGGKVVASMERRNDSDFRSNVAQGGTGVKIDLDEKFSAVARKCAEIIGLDYCGVDLLKDKNGQPIVCEVISNVEKTTGVNVAKLYAEHVINQINKI